MATRDLSAAKDAFQRSDASLSRAAHESRRAVPNPFGEDLGTAENHRIYAVWEQSRYFKNSVIGASNGIILTTMVLCAATGADLESSAVVSVAIALVVCGALSAGLSELLHVMSKRDFAVAEKRREQWEWCAYSDASRGGEKEMRRERERQRERERVIAQISRGNHSVCLAYMCGRVCFLSPGTITPRGKSRRWWSSMYRKVRVSLALMLCSSLLFGNEIQYCRWELLCRLFTLDRLMTRV